jgi:kynurenine formamidase
MVPFPFRAHQITFRAGIGTHIDVPAHCFPGGFTVDQIDLSSCVGPCAVIDISHEVHERSTLSREDIEKFEEHHGPIEAGTIVMVYSGWDRYWDQKEAYLNNNLFPSVSAKAAELLVQRNIAGLGIDTPSPDRPEEGFPVHALLLGAQKYIIENATNIRLLPPTGSYIACLPLKARNVTEAPVRLIGLLHTTKNLL